MGRLCNRCRCYRYAMASPITFSSTTHSGTPYTGTAPWSRLYSSPSHTTKPITSLNLSPTPSSLV